MVVKERKSLFGIVILTILNHRLKVFLWFMEREIGEAIWMFVSIQVEKSLPNTTEL